MKSKWPEIEAKLDSIRVWSRNGIYEKDIAARLGVAISTFEIYKTKHPELMEALKSSKETADDMVENALFEKCIGKIYEEEVAFKCKEVFYDDKGRRCEREEIKTKKVKKYMPPETMAQLAWLNNRRPQSWRRNANKERLDEKRFEHDKDIDDKKYW